MNALKTLAAGLFGALLVALGVEISTARPFETIYALGTNPAWGYGPRELAHSVGFAGCTLAGWALVRSFSTRRGRCANLIAALASICWLPLFIMWPEWMPFTIDQGFRKLVCTIGIPFYFFGTLMMMRFATDCPVITKPLPAALLSAGGMCLWSICWEIGVQPFESVYGGPPRGYIQWAQLISDFIGILAPLLLLALFAGAWSGRWQTTAALSRQQVLD